MSTIPERLEKLRAKMQEKGYLYYSDCRFSSERICGGAF